MDTPLASHQQEMAAIQALQSFRTASPGAIPTRGQVASSSSANRPIRPRKGIQHYSDDAGEERKAAKKKALAQNKMAPVTLMGNSNENKRNRSRKEAPTKTAKKTILKKKKSASQRSTSATSARQRRELLAIVLAAEKNDVETADHVDEKRRKNIKSSSKTAASRVQKPNSPKKKRSKTGSENAKALDKNGDARGSREGWIGDYSPEKRRQRIQRFLEKRQRRVWVRKPRYDVRKSFADSRLRVKGRFIKKEEEMLIRELETLA